MINDAVKKYINQSVLCWLATCDNNLIPNVSPKEVFTYRENNTLLIANIASPNSVNNIKINPAVCVSFIDVFVQKGYKLKGTARIIERNDSLFAAIVKPLADICSDKFPIQSVIEITVTQAEAIQAPSYYLYPDTKETEQIANAMTSYRVKPV